MDNETSLPEASRLGTLLAISTSERLPAWQTKCFQDDDGNEEEGKDKKDDNIDAVKWVVSECGHCLKPLRWGRIFFLSSDSVPRTVRENNNKVCVLYLVVEILLPPAIL